MDKKAVYRRVAVTGLGAITPLGNDVETFWKNLLAGVCAIGPITKFDTSEYKTHIAAEVKNFQPLDYMDKIELMHTDLYAQFAMGAAVQALADSGAAGTVPPERAGVYMGSGIGGIGTFMVEHKKLLDRGPRRVSPYFIPMMIPNMASGMIAIRYGFRGPAMPMVTACASGTNAVGEAMRLIRHGYVDMMVAGGAEATVNEIALAGFSNMQALSASDDPLNASLPFDARRTGFVMGEGAGALVLEEYEHAVSRGAKIYAELAGYGSSCDAYHMTAPDPEAKGAAQAILDAWNELDLDTDRVYVNAHGTGTVMNDKTETLALKKALGDERAHKIAVSSTKSMTGHMLGAAGGAEAVAAVLALRDGIAPPTIGLRVPDPDCDLDYVPLTARKMEMDAALSTSLGFGGHNACLAFKKAGSGRQV
jgi:3-oxoacyl-[acyl-carrier-protein] synthase II